MRNWGVFRKTIRSNFIPPFLEPILYLFALGFGLGGFIPQIEGVSYAAYIAPALISISVMYSSFFECTYGSYVRMYYHRIFEAITATPVNLEEVVAGEILWGATKSFINGTIILFVLFLFGLVQLPTSILVVPLTFLGGFLFASIAMCFTALIPNIDSLNYPPYLFITPMFLFTGTFFPLSLLPPTIQTGALALLPLTHLVNLTRTLTLNIVSWPPELSILWIFAVSLPTFVLAVNLMRRRLIP